MGNAGSPNKKTRIGSVPTTTTFSHVDIAPFRSIFLTKELKKNVNHKCFLAILLLHLESNICNRTQLEVQVSGKNNHFYYCNASKAINVCLMLHAQKN